MLSVRDNCVSSLYWVLACCMVWFVVNCRYAADDQDTNAKDDYNSSDDNEEPAAKRPKPDSQSTESGSQQKLPDHFCDVQLPSEDTDDWKTLFSQFDQPDKIGCMIVELHAGEMLYLPASWFHEVDLLW